MEQLSRISSFSNWKNKAILFTLICLLFSPVLSGQEIGLKDLAVPNSPAFVLTDLTPSTVQTPGTPKTFVLGIAQSFQSSAGGFPQNYSAEFAPYWWFRGDDRNIYALAGIKTMRNDSGKMIILPQENVFSGLKFTSISLAFLNKDLIPDTISLSQKIFSFGFRTTFLKIHQKGYAESIKGKIDNWHLETQKILKDINEELITAIRKKDSAKIAALLQQLLTAPKTTEIAKEINDLMSEKPVFEWDIAAAYAAYGVNDTVWKTGRYGVWTTLSSYLPLNLGGAKPNRNYLNLNVILRYMGDHYQKNDLGYLAKINNLDLGGKLALEFDLFSVGIESLYRYSNGLANTQNRTVGMINYKVADNVYINGAFGKNFKSSDRLIVLFGINWGFGNESVSLPQKK